MTRRTRVLQPNEQAEILNAIRDSPFRQFVQVMLVTGCRPSEVARVTAENARLDLGIWVFDQHKTAWKTRKPRIVYLTAEIVQLSKDLSQRYPEGPIFRNIRGNPFTMNAIRIRFRSLRDKLPHLKHFSAYSARHSFATQALMKGVGIAHVAELLGHSSTTMVSNTYSHLSYQVSHMREVAEKAVN